MHSIQSLIYSGIFVELMRIKPLKAAFADNQQLSPKMEIKSVDQRARRKNNLE